MTRHAYLAGGGWIEVVTGCMFSGKTEELLRRVRRARIARQRVIVFKPAVDDRHADDRVVAHSEGHTEAVAVRSAAEVLRLARELDARVVGVDEAQFFDAELPAVCERLAEDGVRVIVAGLDLDYRGRPFDPLPTLMAIADEVDKTLAVCTVCGGPASRSQRLVHRHDRVLIGAGESYEARCRRHWDPAVFDAEQEALPLREQEAPRRTVDPDDG